ncbi:MAG: DUF1848 domain-containing protein [Deltaproteobacteria bacterium]|nr:DUF1848 domain-containing protein [Deltaproteobacteria bacterium]
MQEKIVISASRRTDIPAFYMDWFMEGIGAGSFSVKNPYNGRISIVPATADAVHSIVFWSKDFSRFIDEKYGKALMRLGYHLYFHFTINCENKLLEPNIPPLCERIDQAKTLCRTFGPATVSWRFDPVCFYHEGQTYETDNTGCLETLAQRLSGFGILGCTTSFVDLYPKVVKKSAGISRFGFIDPPASQKIKMLISMKAILDKFGIRLFTCCEKKVLAGLAEGCGISAGACIDHRILTNLYGPGLSMKKDCGQRASKGCECMVSRDIGDYTAQPCFHDCLFCYANPRACKERISHEY